MSERGGLGCTAQPCNCQTTAKLPLLGGVSMGLKLLTLLYIGGASSCAALMRCQDVDGGGWGGALESCGRKCSVAD